MVTQVSRSGGFCKAGMQACTQAEQHSIAVGE